MSMNFLPPRTAEHPFRLFFPLTCVGLLLAMLPCLALIFAPAAAGAFPLHWHAFAFINVCAGAAFIGFLFTAWPAWTKRFPLAAHSHYFLLLWTALALALPWPRLAQGLSVALWAYLTGLISLWSWRARSYRLVGFTLMLALLTALNVAYAWRPRGVYLHLLVDVMLMAVAMVNFRVGNVLGNEALAVDEPTPDTGSADLDRLPTSALRFVPSRPAKNSFVLLLGLRVLAVWAGASASVQGYLTLAVAAAAAARLQDWHSLQLLRFPPARANYLVQLATALGYGLLGYGLLVAPSWQSPARHLLAVGAMLAMVLLIMAIAGIRHSGLALRFYPDTRLALALVFIAALSRSLGARHWPSLLTIYALPSLCLLLAFLLYGGRYLWIFARTEPR